MITALKISLLMKCLKLSKMAIILIFNSMVKRQQLLIQIILLPLIILAVKALKRELGYIHKNESLRLETQFRSDYAQAAFQALATIEREDESDEEWDKIIQKNIGGIAVGAIDFRDKSKLKNKSKACKSKTNRLSFWQNFIDKIGVMHSIKLQPKQLDLSQHQSMFDWLKKYVSKNLAIAFHVLGKDRFISYILKLVKYGETKFTPQEKS
jgi:hypothetical protein